MKKANSNRRRPVAVIGYALRLPGASSRDAFWQLLSEGRCAIAQIPPDRFSVEGYYHPKAGQEIPGRSYTFAAGLIDNVWDFDPGVFGISPREAAQIDPQQRHLLEVTYEAIEHAGLRPSQLSGSQTGVYVGASSSDHATRFMFDPGAIDVHMMTGNTLSLISNRLSYSFNLHGPSFTVDTACSSSLVAMHLALEAIRDGKIDTAIVGGVNMLLSPFSFLGFARASMLSPSGLCKAFDASGDGYVRAEGAVTLVLRAEDVARRNGDRVHAVVMGSGINQDGRTTGLSLPSADAQATLLSQVYEECGVSPNDLAFVEAHGTGTRVGDPAEAHALGTVLGQRRSQALPIGSVKTNIGHLEPASGLAGVVKSIMALERGTLPASLHFNEPNPDIRFDELNVKVAGEPLRLAKSRKLRHAGVNSFGFGGANAHVVLREAKATDGAVAPSETAPLIVSAHGAAALKALSENYADVVASDNADVAAIANAAAHTRDLLAERLVVARQGLRENLASYLGDQSSNQFWRGTALGTDLDVAFVFSGNGSQWAGMGLAAYEASPVFCAALECFDERFKAMADWSVIDMLHSPDLPIEIRRACRAQPLLFALQVATVEALAEQGLHPSVAVGHSVGEIGAAWCAGALDLDNAIRVVLARSERQEITRHQGGMAAVLVSASEMQTLLDHGTFQDLEIAAINSARSITVAGPKAVIDAFVHYAEQERWRVKRLDLDYPFHCALVDPIERQLLDDLAGLKASPSRIPFVSTVAGSEMAGELLDAEYWWCNVRAPVNFVGGMEVVCGRGTRILVEIGPHQVLGSYLHDALRTHNLQGAVVGTLGRDPDRESDEILATAARVLIAGGRIDLDRFAGPAQRPATELPNYAWQRRRFAVETTGEALQMLAMPPHPLLGNKARANANEWLSAIDADVLPWLGDHRVDEAAVFPAAGFIEIALAAAREVFGHVALEIRDLEILQPLVFDGVRSFEIVTQMSAETNTAVIRSRPRPSGDDGAINAKAAFAQAPVSDVPAEVWQSDIVDTFDTARLYDVTRRRGFAYGPAFRRIASVEVGGDNSARAVFTAAAPLSDRFVLDPTVLDAAFHVLIAMAESNPAIAPDALLLPIRAGLLRVYRHGATVTEVIVRITSSTRRSQVVDFLLLDAAGIVVAELRQARCRVVARNARETPDDLVYSTSFVRRHHLASPSALSGVCANGPAPDLSNAAHAAGDDAAAGDVALVLDAGARAIAYDAVRTLAGNETSLSLPELASSGRLAMSSWPLLAQMLLALSDAGLAKETDRGWELSNESGLPAIPELVDVMLARYPAWIAEATCLARLPELLLPLLHQGLETGAGFGQALLEHLEKGSPAASRLTDIVAGAALDIVNRWPPEEPLRILVVGAANLRLAARIAASVSDRHGTVDVTDLRSDRLDTIRVSPFADRRLRMVAWEQATEPSAGYDLILCAGSLHQVAAAPGRLDLLMQALRSDGAVLAAEPTPSLFADLVHGQSPAWWTRSVNPDFPMSAMLAENDWTQVLEETGLQDITVQTVESTLLISAKPENKHAPANDLDTRSIAIVADTQADSRSMADLLQPRLASAARVVPLQPGEGRTPRRARVVELKDVSASLRGDQHPAATDIVFIAYARRAPDDPVAAMTRQSMAMIDLAKAVGESAGLRLWLVCSGALSGIVDDRAPSSAQTGLWVAARVLQNEFPHIDIRCLDIDPTMAADVAATRIAEAIAHPAADKELWLDAKGQSALRVLRGDVLPDSGDATPGDLLRLEFVQSGLFDSFVWRPVASPAVEAGQIRIDVAATGLNFRDVMWSLGLLPDEALENGFTGPSIGMECAGVVSAVGADVTDLRVGDRVVTFAANAFASHVVVDARMAARIPDDISTQAAATLPVAFLTAHYALVHLARLQPGETVLIHGGAGGVGLAALQIAKACGAKVIATAGTPDRRALLRTLGVDHVFDSRSVSFADDVRRVSQGVDVVLNSLAGEAMTRSIDCLKPFGRFLELGKRDYYQNTHIGLRPFRNNLSYFGIDADQLLGENEVLIGKLFGELMAMFASGELVPLPYRVFEAEETSSAFRLMQRSGQIGKILIRPPRMKPKARIGSKFVVDPNGRYLIAGGLGGFGLATAQWLSAKGARHLVLMSRIGQPTEEANCILAELKAKGVSVELAAIDVADKGALDHYLKLLDGSHVPLKGVFHVAMVLDDALARDLDRSRIEKVLKPKVAGAANLDQLTRRFDLDCFVLFSSVAALIGNVGQANYVAANAFLEGLARRRRAEGLPALAVGFGAISDVGYLARNADVNAALSQRLGRSALSSSEALEGLEALLSCDPRDVSKAVFDYARVDWAMARKELSVVKSALFDELQLDDAAGEGGSLAAAELLNQLRELPDEEVQARLADIVAESITRTLRLPAGEVDRNRALSEFGMDSLMMLELRMGVEETMGIEIPLMSLTSSLTVTDISKRLTTMLRNQDKALLSGQMSVLAQEHIEIPVDVSDADVKATAAAVTRRAKAVDRIL